MRKLYLLILVPLIAITVSGCTLSVAEPAPANSDGGIFKTTDQGVTWQQLGAIPSLGTTKLGIYSLDTSVLVSDPSDDQALYMGTFGDGVFYSYNAGQTWQVMKSLGKKGISDIVVDPKDKCTIYAAAVGKIQQTVDCGRTWSDTFIDNDKKMVINQVVVDHFNNKVMYLANVRGDVMKSLDGGKSWQLLRNFKAEVNHLVMDPHNSKILLTAVRGQGLFITKDGGATWQDLSPRLQLVKADKSFRDLVASPTTAGVYLLAVDYGLFKTVNYGEDWTEIKLILPERRAYINSLALSPFNDKLIYYDTDSTFYATDNGGESWSSRKLPSTRLGSKILVSPVKDGGVYLGLKTQ